MGHTVLKCLDEPVRILSFSVGDLICYLTPFFVGSLFDSLLIVPLLGIGAVIFVKRCLKRFPRFYLVRSFYWLFPTYRFNRLMKMNLPPSHQQILVK